MEVVIGIIVIVIGILVFKFLQYLHNMDKKAYEKRIRENTRISIDEANKMKSAEPVSEVNSSDSTEQLIKLADMLEKGLITEDEFKLEKQKLI